jgi:hypothetical protein
MNPTQTSEITPGPEEKSNFLDAEWISYLKKSPVRPIFLK